MFQILPKWQVDVTLSDGRKIVVWVNDSTIGGVQRKIADIDFAQFPQSVQSIAIAQAKLPDNQSLSQTGVQYVPSMV